MKISKDKMVTINYTLFLDDGSQIDSSVGKEPLMYVHGNGYLIPGMEKELEGKEPGAKFRTVIKPEDAYGEYDSNKILNVTKEAFDTDMPLQVGMAFQTLDQNGMPVIVSITKIDGENITLDGNHELAGKQLTFDVEVLEVRDATEEELKPQGCGCCSGDCGCDGNCGEGCSGGCNS